MKHRNILIVALILIFSGCGGDGLSKNAVAPKDGICNLPHNIIGNRGDKEWIYHTVHGKYYFSTYAEECFATEEDAVAAGYRKSSN